MADYTRRDITTVVRRYTLPSPTHWVEVEKVMAAISNDLSGQSTFDDTVRVEAWDDEIRFTYTLEDGAE